MTPGLRPGALSRIQSESTELNRLQDQLAAKLNPLLKATLGQLVPVPTSATSPGTPGQFAADSTYLYVVVATNAWRRVIVSPW